MSSTMSSSKKILIKPIIITNTKKMVINSKSSGMFLSKMKLTNKMYKEDVIYESSNCDFLKGDSQKVRIVNRVNVVNKSYRTIARCTSKGVSVETTSDDICKLIGQNNYDTILSALGSVFNEETKVRGILALLKKQTTYTSTSTEMDIDISNKGVAEIGVQASELDINLHLKAKQRKRIRRQPFTPYIVKETPAKVRKCVINVEDVVNIKLSEEKKPPIEDIKPDLSEKLTPIEDKKPDLLDLKCFIDEDSNMSCGNVSNLSWPSVSSIPGLLENPNSLMDLPITKDTKAIAQYNMEKPVNSSYIMLRNGTKIFVPVKPEDMFHIATPEILKNVTTVESKLLICEQANYDLKMCLEQDEEGYYPLHVAVLNNDADLVMRQCRALRARRETVDLVAGGLTALHMAIRTNADPPLCTKLLLQHGADPLRGDAERRSAVHLGADAALPQLRCVLEHCDTYPRQVLKNNGDFWKPELESETDKQLTVYLYDRISEMFDEQGYSPLMRACDGGLPAHTALLVARARRVDAPAPSCGATALYRAVAAACLRAKDSGNRSTASENYLKTIEILVENGADPSVENHSGSSVNTLLTEFNICALSMTIANKMTAMKHGRIINNMILYKDKDGRIGYKNLNGLKEIHEDDRNDNKQKCDGKERKTVPLKAVITFDVKNDEKTPKKYMSGKEARKINAINVSKASNDDKSHTHKLNVTTDEAASFKIIKADQNVADKDKRNDKVVIVENVKLENSVFPAAMASGSAVVKPKDFLLTSPRNIQNIHRDKVENMARATGFIKITPKITPKITSKIAPKIASKIATQFVVKKIQVATTSNVKKRKLDNKMK